MSNFIAPLKLGNKRYAIDFGFDDTTVFAGITEDHPWEEWQINLYERLISPNSVCVDIGANVGFNAVAMAHFASAGRVIALEPVPITYKQLSQNAKNNNLANLETLNIGAGAVESSVQILVDESCLAVSRIVDSVDVAPDLYRQSKTAHIESIRVRALDDVLTERSASPLSFLKIDVEGYELEVLEGSHDTLQRSPDLVCICEMSIIAQRLATAPGLRLQKDFLLFQKLKSVFSNMYLITRDTKLNQVSCYAELRLMLLNGHPVEDMLCANGLLENLGDLRCSDWTVPPRLTFDTIVNRSTDLSAHFINRDSDGCTLPSPGLSGTRCAVIVHVAQAGVVAKILFEAIYGAHSSAEQKRVFVALDDQMHVFDLLDQSAELNLPLRVGINFLFIETDFSLCAREYFGNPDDSRFVGARVAIEFEQSDLEIEMRSA